MRVQRLGEVALTRVWAQHQATDTAAIPELGPILPLLDFRRRDMVPPASPVVPGDEDRDLRPKARSHDRVDLVHSPLHPLGDVAVAGSPFRRSIGRVLAQKAVRIEPGNGRQLAGGGVFRELLPGPLLAGGVLDELERVAGVVAPRESRRIKLGRQAWLVIQRWSGLVPIAAGRIVDQGGVGHDQHQVVGRRGPGYVGEVVVTERELAGVAPVVRDVRLLELHARRRGVPGEPRRVPVIGILRRRVGAACHRGAVPAGEGPEVVVVAVVLLDDDHDMLDRAGRCHVQTHLPAWFDHSSWTE